MLRMVLNCKAVAKLYPKTSLIFKQNIHSIYPNIVIPNVNLNEYIWRNVHKWHNKTALVCAETNRNYTYFELQLKTNVLANFLQKFNQLKKSDTVAIVLPNCPEYAIVLLGIIQAGLKATTINPYFTPDEMSRLLLLPESKLVITTPEIHNSVLETLRISNLNIPIIVVKTKKESVLPSGTINFNDIVNGTYTTEIFSQNDQEDTIIIPFSSGTTGHPKGVELSSRNVIAALEQISSREVTTLTETNGPEQEIVPIILPMHHIYGLVPILMHGLIKGCKMVTIPKFKSQLFIDVLEKHKPTMLFLVPPICNMILNNNNVKQSHLVSVKHILSGGAHLGAADVMALREKLNDKVVILQAYGSTESTSISTCQSKLLINGIKPGGIGLIVQSTEVKIVSTDDGKELGVNDTGELWIKAPQVMKGYYKNEKATNETITEDGWYKTGDVGHYDEDDHFFVTDRIKDLIKVKGYQVAPAELEDLLRQHPDVEDTAIVGIPHKMHGEAPKAFVVLKRDSKITTSAIQEFVNSKVVKYKQLTGGVIFIDAIPKTPSGKVLRRELKLL